MSFEDDYSKMKLMSTTIQLKLQKGELEWEDEEVQFFIPAALFFTDFDWLELIAENNLIEEDAVIVKRFLKSVKSLTEINSQLLEQEIEKKLRKLFK